VAQQIFKIDDGIAQPLRYGDRGISPAKEHPVAKAQKKSNKEVRKPKAEKGPKANASNPSTKQSAVGIVTIKS
jgi:hypothetical protein